MVDWKTYKGLGPWSFAKSQADNLYNVGNKIVSTSQPVWDINHSGIPITGRHDPCGVWVSRPVSSIPELNPIVPVIINPGIALRYIAWSPYAGGTLGRFVGLDIGDLKTYYSDNGGASWLEGGIPEAGVWTTHQFTFANNLFIWTYSKAAFKVRSSISSDGINWTPSANIAPDGLHLSDVTYHPGSGKYILVTSTGGDISRIFESDDALNWTYIEYAGMYSTYYLDVHKDRIYALSRNYNLVKVSSTTHPFIWGGLLGDSPWGIVGTTSQRGELRSNGSILVYSKAYMNESNNWIPIDNAEVNVSRIDYNPYSIAFGATTFLSPRRSVYISRDGINWNDEVLLIIGEAVDIAVGYDRAVVACGLQVAIIML